MDFGHDDHSQGELPEAYAPHFQGTARFQSFASPFDRGPAVFAVHFDAGGRTRPHVHRSGQVLYVTEGRGIVADRTGRHTVGPGDVVTVSPDEWHWHGGTTDTPITHLTIQMPQPEDIDWDVEEGDWATGYGSGADG